MRFSVHVRLDLNRIRLPIHRHRCSVGEGCPLSAPRRIEKLVVRHFEQADALVQRRQPACIIEVGIGAPVAHLRGIAVEEGTQVVG